MQNKIKVTLEGATVAQVKAAIQIWVRDNATVKFSDPVETTQPGYAPFVTVIETHPVQVTYNDLDHSVTQWERVFDENLGMCGEVTAEAEVEF